MGYAEINNTLEQLSDSGYGIINDVFSEQEIAEIKTVIHNYFTSKPEELKKPVYAIRQLLIELPQLKELLLNDNVRKILSTIMIHFSSVKLYFLINRQSQTGM